MNVYEMEAAIRATLNEPTQTCISSAEVLSALNDGYKDVASKALCIEEETLLPIEENEKIIIASGGLKVQYAQITDAVLAEVSYTVTAPVGYDTWTCDGVEYQGKIVTVGAGMMYATPKLGCSVVHGLPPYTKKGLVLIYPGTYIENGFNIVTPPGAGYYTFVRGVGSVEDVVVAGSPAALAGGQSTSIIEGLYLQNNYSLGYPPFMVNDGAVSCIYNKCKSSQISLHSTAWFGSNSVLDMRYCTCISPASSGYGTIYSSYASTDNTKSHLRKTYISEYFGLYGGTGSLGTEDYVEEATVGYGHEYGDYLISDWEFDGTKKKMSYGGGAAVDVAAGGSFTLTNTDGASIDIYVVADDLPASDDTFTIYNSKYVNGVIIV